MIKKVEKMTPPVASTWDCVISRSLWYFFESGGGQAMSSHRFPLPFSAPFCVSFVLPPVGSVVLRRFDCRWPRGLFLASSRKFLPHPQRRGGVGSGARRLGAGRATSAARCAGLARLAPQFSRKASLLLRILWFFSEFASEVAL